MQVHLFMSCAQLGMNLHTLIADGLKTMPRCAGTVLCRFACLVDYRQWSEVGIKG